MQIGVLRINIYAYNIVLLGEPGRFTKNAWLCMLKYSVL